MIRRTGISLLLTGMNILMSYTQSIDLEKVGNLFGKGNLLKVNGGFNLSAICYESSGDLGERDPFTYYFNGNLNLNICNIMNMPFMFSLTNSGNSYKLPSLPNRFSIHPSYKWIRLHAGDISMVFSPYTLNGHLFTGAGVDLSPGTNWNFSVMCGRLQKAVEYNETESFLYPAYERMGYGVKVGWKKRENDISLNVFTAKDDPGSLEYPPDSLGITPVQNLAGSLRLTCSPIEKIRLTAEYALSLWTNDIRSPGENALPGILKYWPASKMSSAVFDAVQVQLSYVLPHSMIGLGYERIDPGYQTLGAYYFANDLENITVNASQSLLSNRLNIALSMGYQHDNLANDRLNATSRWVGNAQINAGFGEKVSASVSFSNFQTFTHVRSDFEQINRLNTLDRPDTLSFAQLSRSAGLNLNILMRKNETQQQNLNINLNYQDVADKQGGVYHPGSVSGWTNAAFVYTLAFLASGSGLHAGLNLNENRISGKQMITWGPAIGSSHKFFRKKLQISNNISYNASYLSKARQQEVYSFRANAVYRPCMRHAINLSCNFQWRSHSEQGTHHASVGTVGYNYSF